MSSRNKMTGAAHYHGIKTVADISKLLEVEERVLTELAGKTSAYVWVGKEKVKDKIREFIKAQPPLSLIQKNLNRNILAKLHTPHAMHGYKRGRSNVTHAASHVRAPLILRYDLKDFFPSIKYQRVFKFFHGLGADSAAANILTRLTTFRGSLPLGFSTSPAIANQVVAKLVRRLDAFARSNSLTFTAYADNFEVSGPCAAKRFSELIRKIIEQEGFNINIKKSHPLRGNIRKELTGVVVNEKPSWGRNRIREMRARITRIRFEGLPADPEEKAKLLSELQGYVAYVASVNPEQGQRVRELIEKL